MCLLILLFLLSDNGISHASVKLHADGYLYFRQDILYGHLQYMGTAISRIKKMESWQDNQNPHAFLACILHTVASLVHVTIGAFETKVWITIILCITMILCLRYKNTNSSYPFHRGMNGACSR